MSLFDQLLGVLFSPKPELLSEVMPGRRVLVRGDVVPRDTLSSPLTGTECVYYQYTVEEWRDSAIGTQGFWQLSQRDEAIAEFYVADGDTRAVVAPFRARVERQRRREPIFFSLGNQKQRAQELLLCPGDEIEVQGIADAVTDVHDEQRGFREPATRLMIRAPAGEQIVIRLVQPKADSGRRL